MKIIRHTARDMRQAMRAVREQLGDDAVILASRRTAEGVEVTAAVDFEAGTLEAGGFAAPPTAPPVPALQAPSVGALQAPVAFQAPPVAASAALHSPPPAPAPVLVSSHTVNQPLFGTVLARAAEDAEWISAAAREAVAAHSHTISSHALPPTPPVLSAAAPEATRPNAHPATPADVPTLEDPIESVQTAALSPLGPELTSPLSAATAAIQSDPTADAMGKELRTLRRILETQLAHLAWNDLARRAPVRMEMLRELSEIGITHDLAEHLVRQLPEDQDLTFARRFTIPGLSQYLQTTGDRWLDDGGRVAFVGATGVGKTTTLAKIAVRWVLRHGARDIALVAADSVRIGAQDQLRSLAQMLGVPVYAPEKFENLPTLVSGLTERLVLIDTPGCSVRDSQLAGRLAVLANSASRLETALVLAASTQAGSIEEAVRHFAPTNPSCCVLTKLDEAASLGGVLSILIRARLPIAYTSEGQRVPEDLRPARALELVSAAVRLAKASGATADEDLLRRRFGKSAHGFT